MSQPPVVLRYGAVAQSAHWLTFLLLIGSFTLGYWMTELAMSPTRLKLYAYHKWIGVTIFALVALRLSWRLLAKAPPLPDSVPAWERRLAGLTHAALYLLLFAVPLSGWLMSSAKGFQTVYFQVLPIPDLIGKNKELVFALAGALLLASGAWQWHARSLPCPADRAQAAACAHARKVSWIVWGLSVALFLVGAFFAFFAAAIFF